MLSRFVEVIVNVERLRDTVSPLALQDTPPDEPVTTEESLASKTTRVPDAVPLRISHPDKGSKRYSHRFVDGICKER